MPLITKKAEDIKLSVWIIHTGRPGYKIMLPELDPETKRVMEAKVNGKLESDPFAKTLARKNVAVESIEYDPEREKSMLWAQADEYGDFILENGVEAALVWDKVKKDPPPKATLDPRSPELPPLPPKK